MTLVNAAIIEASGKFECPGRGTVQSLSPLADSLACVLAHGRVVKTAQHGDSLHIEALEMALRTADPEAVGKRASVVSAGNCTIASTSTCRS